MKKTLLIVATLLFYCISFGQMSVFELGRLTYGNNLSDVWGHVDEMGNEYALVGVNNGFSVVDVTDPASPVEVYFEPGVQSIWRDIKSWDNHAYVSTEGGGGILIVDLSPLPGPVTTTAFFTGDTYPFSSVHNIYIDESGKLYILGSDNGAGGAIICDLNGDPMNPVELGRFDNFYLHDGMARGDTLWGSAIYEGLLAAIDVSDPANISLMGTVSTPGEFTHNAWVSDNGQHVFTTDEVSSAFITAYDVTDLDNMFETDRVHSSPGSGVIPHNAHVHNNFIVTSYYTDGVTIHDSKRPGNLIETGKFDTSPNYSGDGYNGCWGVYPYLPSGNILASDMQEGLYVLQADYTRACYVEGIVTDSATSLPLGNVTVAISGTDAQTVTGLDGNFAFGIAEAGTYNISFSYGGYPDTVIRNVALVNGQLTELSVTLSSWYTGLHDQVDDNSLTIYPNPFSSDFTIETNLLDLTSAEASLQVFDLSGRLLEKQPIGDGQSKIQAGGSLRAGIYIVKIMSGNRQVAVRKVIRR